MDQFDIIEAPPPTTEENIKEVVTDELQEFNNEETMPIIKEKEYIVPDEVFKKEKEFIEYTDSVAPPIIKKPRKKRTMTPETLEKLKVARAKANETRRRNKELRLQGKMPTKKEVIKKEKEEEVEKRRPVINNITHETKNITNNITEDDIARISMEATRKTLLEYEIIRKERKEEKRKVKAEEQRKLKVANQINTALGRRQQTEFISHYF